MPSNPEDPITNDTRPQPIDYLTIAVVSCVIMVYQIALTRVLSVVVWYHFAFLTISLVMLGLGVPGIWLADRKVTDTLLPRFLLVGGLAIPFSIAVLVNFRIFTSISATSAVMIIPFAVLPVTLALGGAICLLLMRAPGAYVSRMYGADLAGAAVGAIAVIPLMSWIPTPLLAASTGLPPLICGALYGGKMARGFVAAAVVVVLVLLQGGPFQIWMNKVNDERAYDRIAEQWTPIARLTVFREDKSKPFTWGAGSKMTGSAKGDHLWLEQDGSAGTPITPFDGDLESVSFLHYDVTTVGYQIRKPKRVAVIGGGGGRDILSALIGGANDVDAIELNGATIDLVSNTFAEVSGDIYHHPFVHAYAREGRSHLTHSDGGFDVIQISLIDSWAASAAGAFALAENNLYTVEAFQLFRSKLSDDGLLSTSRWKSELPRLLTLARASLEADGVQPEKHLALVITDEAGTLLTSMRPFDDHDLQKLREVCEERGFELVYPADANGPEPALRRIVDEGAAHLAEAGLNVEAPTDDSPYFFHVVSPFRLRALPQTEALTGLRFNLEANWMLQYAMGIVCFMAGVLFLLPFASRSAERWGTSTRHLIRASIYFSAIGAAFMLLENMLLQHFVLYLGHPSYATTVILATLLIGMGLGSTSAEPIGVQRLQRFGFVVPILVAVAVLSLPTLFAETIGWPLTARVLVSCVLLAPLGAILGLFFPLGMIRFGDEAKPWYWAVNGIFGVVASVLSLALSMELGFTTVGLLAALGYATAYVALRGDK